METTPTAPVGAAQVRRSYFFNRMMKTDGARAAVIACLSSLILTGEGQPRHDILLGQGVEGRRESGMGSKIQRFGAALD